MYNEINKLINNDLKYYDKRPVTQKTIDREFLSTISSYTSMWAMNECYAKRALKLARPMSIKLSRKIATITSDLDINLYEYFIQMLEQLNSVHEELCHEEEDNLGFGKRARKLRKMWRVQLRECHKYLDKSTRNKILYIKEWRKPRTVYILNTTGECHNGLYWTFRALISTPSFIKYGFTKEKKI